MFRIEGEKIYLVPFEETHLNNSRYFSWLGDYDVVKHIYRFELLKPQNFEDVKQYVHDVWKSKYAIFLAIHTKDKGDFIGTVKLNYFDDAGLMTNTIDIGIMIGEKNQWGNGYATDAISAVCRYAFKNLSIRKITAGCMENNIGIQKVFSKLGFKEEARLRKKLLFEGEYFNHILLGCFKEEFIENVQK